MAKMHELISIKYLGKTVYIKCIDRDGLIWIRRAQVVRVAYIYNHSGYDTYELFLDPDFGEHNTEEFYIHIEFPRQVFLTEEACIASICEDIQEIKNDFQKHKKKYNSETITAIKEAEERVGLIKFKSIDEIFEKVENEDNE